MKAPRKHAVALLWSRAVLSWKLDSTQQELYSSYVNAKHKTVVWSCSRRLGKSYTLCVLAVEQCLKKPNSIVKYVAPQQKMVKTIIKPLLRDILQDCPKDLVPEFKTNDNVYRFRNGSEIQIAGADAGNIESLRGGAAELCIVDEAGFCDDLNYAIRSVLTPTTLTTNGKIILASTPPKSPGHEFTEYIKRAEVQGALVKKTIYDNPRLTKEQIQDIIAEYGGEDDVEFQREFLCEQIVDEEWAVVPEFTSKLAKEIVKPWKRPPFYDRYVAADIGFKDLTVVLFAYYDFRSAKIIIEDELVLSGHKMTTDYLASQIKQKETALYEDPLTFDIKPPYLRISDNNLIVINDLNQLHKLTFLPTAKDDSQAAINSMRIALKQERIIINPRCETLIRHLKNATWAKNRKTFDRSPDDGHYDAVDALKYLVRNVQINKNPYPASYGKGSHDDWFYPEQALGKERPQSNPAYAAIGRIFKPRKSLKN